MKNIDIYRIFRKYLNIKKPEIERKCIACNFNAQRSAEILSSIIANYVNNDFNFFFATDIFETLNEIGYYYLKYSKTNIDENLILYTYLFLELYIKEKTPNLIHDNLRKEIKNLFFNNSSNKYIIQYIKNFGHKFLFPVKDNEKIYHSNTLYSNILKDYIEMLFNLLSSKKTKKEIYKDYLSIRELTIVKLNSYILNKSSDNKLNTIEKENIQNFISEEYQLFLIHRNTIGENDKDNINKNNNDNITNISEKNNKLKPYQKLRKKRKIL